MLLYVCLTEAPGAPSQPTFSEKDVGARKATLSWTKPSSDGFSPIRNYTVQQLRVDAEWTTLSDVIQAVHTTYTATK